MPTPDQERQPPHTTRLPHRARIGRGAVRALLAVIVVIGALGPWIPRVTTAETAWPRTPLQTEAIVQLPTAWHVGDRLQLEMIRERERSGGTPGTPTSTASTTGAVRSTAELEVLRRLPDGYLMRWTWFPATADPEVGPDQVLAARLTQMIGTIAVDVRTDADGAPLTIENVPELVAANHRAASALGDLLRREGAPEAQVALVMDMVAALTSEEVVVASALREPQLFMLAAGGSFRPGATVTYQEMLPNPFGGEPFPSTAWFRLAQVDAQAGSATVEWGQSLDRERASGLLQEVLRLLVERTGAALPDGATIPELPLAIDDAATIIMDVRTGWPQSVHWERATTAGAARQVERVTFRARPGELG